MQLIVTKYNSVYKGENANEKIQQNNCCKFIYSH